jgi:hypothetical protein
MHSLLQFKSYLPGFLASQVKPAIDAFAISAKFISRIELFFNVLSYWFYGKGFRCGRCFIAINKFKKETFLLDLGKFIFMFFLYLSGVRNILSF